MIQELIEKTDGVPLYVEEMTKAVVASGLLKETDGRYEWEEDHWINSLRKILDTSSG